MRDDEHDPVGDTDGRGPRDASAPPPGVSAGAPDAPDAQDAPGAEPEPAIGLEWQQISELPATGPTGRPPAQRFEPRPPQPVHPVAPPYAGPPHQQRQSLPQHQPLPGMPPMPPAPMPQQWPTSMQPPPRRRGMPAWGWVLSSVGAALLVTLVVVIGVHLGLAQRSDVVETTTASTDGPLRFDGATTLQTAPTSTFDAAGWSETGVNTLPGADSSARYVHSASGCRFTVDVWSGEHVDDAVDDLAGTENDLQSALDAGVVLLGAPEIYVQGTAEGGGVELHAYAGSWSERQLGDLDLWSASRMFAGSDHLVRGTLVCGRGGLHADRIDEIKAGWLLDIRVA